MSIDWLLNHDCRAKKALSPLGIFRRRQVVARFEIVSEIAKLACPKGSISALEMDVFEHDPQVGPVIRSFAAADAAELARQLENHQTECADCPANVRSVPYGCFGNVRFPISAAAEEWLIQSLPRSMSTPAGKMLAEMMHRLGCDGRAIRWLRQYDGRYFELEKAPSRHWTGPGGMFAIDTDGLYQSMFITNGTEGVSPFHGVLLCYFVGGLDDSSLPGFMATHGDIVPRGFRVEPTMEREPSTNDLKFYFLALYRAACLGLNVSVRIPRQG